MNSTPASVVPDPGLVTYTHVIYGLHALSAVTGIFTGAAVVSAFVFGIPSIVAVVMNYVRRSEVRGTWLESHFTWQIRTFWGAFFAAVAIVFVSILLLPLFGLGFVTGFAGFFLLGIWIIYRVARGWLALKDRRPMPA